VNHQHDKLIEGYLITINLKFQAMPYDFSLTSEVLNGRTFHYATLNGSTQPKFIIGNRTKYGSYFGLTNLRINPGLVYDPVESAKDYGFWAYFILPTAQGESQGSFTCLNTYDTAKFTFSFMQYGAHVPNGDFVRLFKKLLALPNANDYFSKLIMKDNRIFLNGSDGVLKQLENDTSTQPLMDYLNPSLQEVETQELACSARFVHWAINDAAHRQVQVTTAIEGYKNNMIAYNKRYNLDGSPAKVCQMVCDIRHQGRASSDLIIKALNTQGNHDLSFTNLCSLGTASYGPRIETVRNSINSLLATGIFNKKYDSTSNSFVNM
jgi:hypothetical protein